MPRRIVGRDNSVALATSEMPRRPNARASEAAQQRRALSCSNGARGTFCSSRSVTVATWNEWGENSPGNPAAWSRRFILR